MYAFRFLKSVNSKNGEMCCTQCGRLNHSRRDCALTKQEADRAIQQGATLIDREGGYNAKDAKTYISQYYEWKEANKEANVEGKKPDWLIQKRSGGAQNSVENHHRLSETNQGTGANTVQMSSKKF